MPGVPTPYKPLARRLAGGVLAAGLVAAGLANAADKAVPTQTLKRLLGEQAIGERHELPSAGGIAAIEVDGKLYILSANGRYLFDGTLRDLWHDGRVLDSMADIERYALRLDLDALGLDFSKLVSVDMGGTGKTVTAFIAPDCPACGEAIEALAELGERYALRVVVVPRPGGVAAVRRIDCARDPGRRRELVHSLASASAPQAAPECKDSKTRVTSTLLAARVIGVDQVPFVIAPDGRVSKGMPTTTTLADFLAGGEDTDR